MVFALQKISPTIFDSLADYPHWFVVACVTIVAAVVLWLTVKVLKWTLWVMLIAVLLAGGAVVVALLLK